MTIEERLQKCIHEDYNYISKTTDEELLNKLKEITND